MDKLTEVIVSCYCHRFHHEMKRKVVNKLVELTIGQSNMHLGIQELVRWAEFGHHMAARAFIGTK